ncbi:MAG TPA: type II toxin-antitoxin system RelE/ParE family toxin [Ruminococcaceae bacterium]|nr:type II toxin-antitoxin system RelE/ParE family toxin [Oscillospiraceae bacterium]
MNKLYSVVYSPKAKDDLKEIYTYIAFTLSVPTTAEKQINRIRKAIRSLDFMPLRNPAVDWEPWKSKGMRKVTVDKFIAFYTVDSCSLTVTVIRIFYGGQDIANIAADFENL